MHVVCPVIIFGLLWFGLMFPIKAEVKKRVGSDKYTEIINEYKKMKRDRNFGAIAISLGVISLLGVCFAIALKPYLIESRADAKSMVMMPSIFICAGIYCYLMGFVKAMANQIRPSKE